MKYNTKIYWEPVKHEQCVTIYNCAIFHLCLGLYISADMADIPILVCNIIQPKIN